MELTILKPNETVSPRSISRKTRIPLEYVENILIELSHQSLIDVKFIIFCTNDDSELVHGFEFNSKKLLKDFIVNESFLCPNCKTKLATTDIRVAFVKKEHTLKAL